MEAQYRPAPCPTADRWNSSTSALATINAGSAARPQPRCRVYRLAVMPQLDIQRRAACGGSGFPARHHPHRLAGDNALAKPDVQAIEAGQHDMIAAAAVDDQQQAVAAEALGEHHPSAAGGA